MTNKFKIVCQKLRETKLAYDEAKFIMNYDVCKIKNAVSEITKQSEEENNQNKLTILIQQLKEENCIKDKKLCHMNMKIRDLEIEKKNNVLKINKQRKLIKNMKMENRSY